ncbi:MAG: Unknown protein [uncultured Sulfurovum sp.]|uniref:Uncharacterized protein n=1 Tax=uncultured Sulfurovum sp. TaxID=269237 RepID=A0A6S6T977_9BACT|nr:MAG: Unknown protein [uncultured Sulfurovum sp.]
MLSMQTTHALESDFNGDGRLDVLVKNINNGRVNAWLNSDAETSNHYLKTLSSEVSIVNIADINGDGKSDVILKNEENRRVNAWISTTGQSTNQYLKTLSSTVEIVDVADINGDGKDDIIVKNNDNRRVNAWLSTDGQSTNQYLKTLSSKVEIVDVADINGDGKDDIIVQNSENRRVNVWLSTDGQSTNQYLKTLSSTVEIVDVADMNGDAKDDIVVQNSDNGRVNVWLSTAGQSSNKYLKTLSSMVEIIGTADINGDAKDDILVKNKDNHRVNGWLSTDGESTNKYLKTLATDLKIVMFGDVDADGNADIIVQNSLNGRVSVWLNRDEGTNSKYLKTLGEGVVIFPEDSELIEPNPLFTAFNVGLGGSSSFPFASQTEGEKIWVSTRSLILDEHIENNGYYANMKAFEGEKFAELQTELKKSKFFTLWFVEGWQESWYNKSSIQELMDAGYIPVISYWYFGDKLIEGMPDTTKQEAYKVDNLRIADFLADLNGTKMILMEPEFNKASVLESESTQHAFAGMISDAIDTIKVKNPEILVSLSMMDTGSRGVYNSAEQCGYENCALGDKAAWSEPEIIFTDLMDKLDFISFNQMVAQFSRDYENPGGWYTPNPRKFTAEDLGIDFMAERVSNFSKFLHEKYKKPVYLPYIAIATATWDDVNNNNEIEDNEVAYNGWEDKANSVYKRLSQLRTELQENGLFGFAPMALFDNPRHDYGGYQYFMNNEYHLGIIGSSAIDEVDIATHGDLNFKSHIVNYIYDPSFVEDDPDDPDNPDNPDDKDSVAQAKEALTFERIKNTNLSETMITENLSLITLGEAGVSITWETNASAISPEGIVSRGATDIWVTVTATLTKGTQSAVKTFILLLMKEEVNAGFCQVDYNISAQWNTGATISVKVTNHLGNLSDWVVSFTFPSEQTLNGDLWNGVETQNGSYVSVLNEFYNNNVKDGGIIEFGFNLFHGGENEKPSDIRLNGKLCDGQIGGIEKPAKPTELSAELVDNIKVNLTWIDNSDNEDAFFIYESVNDEAWTLLTSVKANVVSYDNISVQTDKHYAYKVEAKNVAGGTGSDSVSIVPLNRTVQSGTKNNAIALVANCMACHTATNSDSSIPIIHGLDRDYLEKTLKGYRTTDEESQHFSFAMHRIVDGYTDDELEIMVEYFSAQTWIGNTVVSYDVDTIKLGKTLYESNCVACHGVDAVQDNIMLSKQSEQYLADTMKHYAQGLHKDADIGMRNVFENSIGDDTTKIEALAKYLAVGLEVPSGSNDSIREFRATYVSASNKILASWAFINPETNRVDVLVNGVVVQTLTDLNISSLWIDNDGENDFIIGENYDIQLKATNDGNETLSTKISVAVMSDQDAGALHYNANCKVCHGVNGTARADITLWNPNNHSFSEYTQASIMPESYYSNCDEACLDLIGVYVQNVLEPRARENNDTDDAEDVYADIPRGYRLLNTVEYSNTLHSLFEISEEATRAETLALNATDLPKDNIVEGYNTDRDMNRIDEDSLNALSIMANRVESYLTSIKGKTDAGCLINNYDFCIADKSEFLSTFATKIFRRPLTEIELTTYESIEEVSQIVGDMLVSPKFLYRSEMGNETNITDVYALTSYEIATALAYSISGTTPDDILLGLADNGALFDANTRFTQAVRLSALETGKDKLDDFIGRWLLEDNIYSLFDKNPEKFPGYNNEVRTAQSNQIVQYFRMVMESNEHSRYKDLFVNEYMMSNEVISNYYGEGMSNSESFEKVPATSKRYGVLTLGAIASKYANSEESHPFKRGNFVLARLMCHPLGLPGNGGDVPAIIDHAGENQRDRYAQHVNDPSCATCHNVMDPIGFTWENYDGSGRYRTSEYHSEEHGGPKVIDTSVTLKGLLTFDEAETHSATSIRDVSEIIAESDRGPECMALQYYRYISGDSHAEIENSLVLKKIVSDFREEEYDLQSLFINMVKLQSFVTRRGVE